MLMTVLKCLSDFELNSEHKMSIILQIGLISHTDTMKAQYVEFFADWKKKIRD